MTIAHAPRTIAAPDTAPRRTARSSARSSAPTGIDTASHVPAARTDRTPSQARAADSQPLFDELAQLVARPLDNLSRTRVDAALALMVGPDGVAMTHLVPDAATPDVVRHRIAGRALTLLARDRDAAQRVLGPAIAVLRA